MVAAPDFGQGNVPDPAILAQRRARRAEIAEEQLRAQLVEVQREADRQRGRADALGGELEIARTSRQPLLDRLDALERELRLARQREHGERQLRIDVQDDLAEAFRDVERMRQDRDEDLRNAEQRADELARELRRSGRNRDEVEGLVERHAAARRSAEAELATHDARMEALRERLEGERDAALVAVADLELRAAAVDGFRGRLDELRAAFDEVRLRHEIDIEHHAVTQRALAEVSDAATRARVQADEAQLQRAEAQERLAQARARLNERDAEITRMRAELERAGEEVGTLRATLQVERDRTTAQLDAGETRLRAELLQRRAALEARAVRVEDRIDRLSAQMRGALGLPPAGPTSREVRMREAASAVREELDRVRERIVPGSERDLTSTVDRLIALVRTLRERTTEPPPPEPVAETPSPDPEIPSRSLDADEPRPPMVADLDRAAERLRNAHPPLEDEADDTPSVEPEPESEPEPAIPSRDELSLDDRPNSSLDVGEGWERFVPPPRRPPRPSPWLASALAALARREPAVASGVFLALLRDATRLQRGASKARSLRYDVELPDRTWPVAHGDGTIHVGGVAGRPSFTIAGHVADLAGLVAGGATRFGPGVAVRGSRRRLRRLLRAQRRPMRLVDVAGALDPGQALALLTTADGPHGGVSDPVRSIILRTPAGDLWHVIVAAGALRAGPGAAAQPAAAIVHGSPAALVAMLGGAALPGLSVLGDADLAGDLLGVLCDSQTQ